MKDRVRAGEYKERIYIQVRTDVQNADNSQRILWPVQFECWARVESGRGMEPMAGGGRAPECDFKFSIRYNPVFTPKSKNRVVYRQRVFDIVYVNNVLENNHEVLLSCNELIGETP